MIVHVKALFSPFDFFLDLTNCLLLVLIKLQKFFDPKSPYSLYMHTYMTQDRLIECCMEFGIGSN